MDKKVTKTYYIYTIQYYNIIFCLFVNGTVHSVDPSEGHWTICVHLCDKW